jgi:hypothetical protein
VLALTDLFDKKVGDHTRERIVLLVCLVFFL